MSARGVSALQLLASPLAQRQPCGHCPCRATRPWSLPLRPRPVPPRLERLPRVARCLEVAFPSPWTRCHLSLWRTCWQLLALAGATDHRPRHACRQLLVSVRRDLRCHHSRCLTQEGRERCRQHLTDNRCSHPNVLPPSRAPPPVPAGIRKVWLRRQEALRAGPLLGGLGKDREGASPRREDLKSAAGLTQMTI